MTRGRQGASDLRARGDVIPRHQGLRPGVARHGAPRELAGRLLLSRGGAGAGGRSAPARALRWGIEAPGGKGGARGFPESFLSHVLLGDQGDVPLILERSLASDRDGSGKERLHQALSALSQDPFKRVLEAAQARVDAAFTPTGRRKTGQSSPLSQIKEQITLLAREFERLTQQRRESEEVQQRIASFDEERLAIEAEIGTLEVCVDRDIELVERLAARRRAAERVAQAARALKIGRRCAPSSRQGRPSSRSSVLLVSLRPKRLRQPPRDATRPRRSQPRPNAWLQSRPATRRSPARRRHARTSTPASRSDAPRTRRSGVSWSSMASSRVGVRINPLIALGPAG